jgi:hypothetical protein
MCIRLQPGCVVFHASLIPVGVVVGPVVVDLANPSLLLAVDVMPSLLFSV